MINCPWPSRIGYNIGVSEKTEKSIMLRKLKKKYNKKNQTIKKTN
jgi:hypothetical protein